MASLTVGVLALQGGFHEHLTLLDKAGSYLTSSDNNFKSTTFTFLQVKTPEQLSQCDGLIIPGGESTTMALVAAQSGLLEPLRDFVKVQKKPTWGTCAGLILLSQHANASKQGGQELIGGLGVRVHRNHFGRQIESFEADLSLPFVDSRPFHGVFIRAPVVEEVLGSDVEVLAKLPGRLDRMKKGVSLADPKDDSGDVIAVRQGNVLGMSFHPELTSDERIHAWWLRELVAAK